MIQSDEDNLICDFAETYGIFDYRSLPPLTVAILAIGLRDNSRIKMSVSDVHITLDQALLANIADSLRFIAWTKTKHGRKYTEKSILKTLMDHKKKDDYKVFNSVEDFDRYMKQFEG